MLRYFFYIICIVFSFISCTESGKKMHLSGDISGLKKGTIYLQKIEDTLLISVDSTEVDGEAEFEFTESIEEPEVYYLTMQFKDSLKTEQRIPFFAEASEVNIHSKLENFEISYEITGSANQEKWEEYKKMMKRYNDKNLELIQAYYNAAKAGKDSLARALDGQQQKLTAARFLATINFAKNNQELAIAPYLMLTEASEANISYHDTIYQSLSPKIKDSRYGKQLESFINANKAQ